MGPAGLYDRAIYWQVLATGAGVVAQKDLGGLRGLDTKIKETNGALVLCYMISIKWLAISKNGKLVILKSIFHGLVLHLHVPSKFNVSLAKMLVSLLSWRR